MDLTSFGTGKLITIFKISQLRTKSGQNKSQLKYEKTVCQ